MLLVADHKAFADMRRTAREMDRQMCLAGKKPRFVLDLGTQLAYLSAYACPSVAVTVQSPIVSGSGWGDAHYWLSPDGWFTDCNGKRRFYGRNPVTIHTEVKITNTLCILTGGEAPGSSGFVLMGQKGPADLSPRYVWDHWMTEGWDWLTRSYRHQFTGAIILHGAHDGFGSGQAPSFCVDIGRSEAGWSIHT